MKHVLLLFLILASGQLARAQTFRPGWLLPAQGDTLRGELEDNAWVDAPTQVRYRSASGGDIRTLPAAEVRAFRLTGGRFFRRETLPLDRAAQTQLARLQEGDVRRQQPETFLAEVLVDGPASLLYTAVDDVPHYFVRRPDRPVLELAARSLLRFDNAGRRVVANGNNYQGQLQVYFGDCPAALKAIGRFEAAALVAVVQAYNRQCATPPQAGTEYRPARYQPGVGLAVRVLAGGRYNSSGLRAEQTSSTTGLDRFNLDGSVHPVGGLELDVFEPGRHGALHVAGLLSTIGRETSLSVGGVEAQLANRLTLLELRLGGRYYWSAGRGGEQFLAGLGVTLPASLSNNTYNPRLVYTPNGAVALPDAYPRGLLPYLEAGLRRGRLTLLLEGRVQRLQQWELGSYSPDASGYPRYSADNYSQFNWYTGLTLGFEVLTRR